MSQEDTAYSQALHNSQAEKYDTRRDSNQQTFPLKACNCTLGGWWIFVVNLILNESTPGMYSFLCKKTENNKKKFFVK
jgi:hypothetical protein